MTFLDTGPLVAVPDDTDQWHTWATPRLLELNEPLWTCGAVLSETSFLLGRHPPAVALIYRQHDDKPLALLAPFAQ
jgi:hypothetical protein